MKKKKLWICKILVIVFCVISLEACKKSEESSSAIKDIPLEDGQTMVTGQITEINGNEIRMELVRESTMTRGKCSGQSEQNEISSNERGSQDSLKDQNEKDVQEQNGSQQRKEYQEENDSQKENMPQGEEMSQGRSMPQKRNISQEGRMPQEGNMPQREEMSKEGNNSGSTQTRDDNTNSQKGERDSENQMKMDEKLQKEMTVYEETGEEKEVTIPVGTKVTTQLNSVTTFSRLAEEDVIKVILEKDEQGNEVVVGVWIVG